jgi:hypothetical protein
LSTHGTFSSGGGAGVGGSGGGVGGGVGGLGVGGFDFFLAAALAAAARIVDAVVGPDRIDAALSIDARVFRRDTLSSWLMRALSSASDSPVPKCDGCARSPHCVSWKWDGW